MAGPQGFEPRISVPKTDVIPLHHGPILVAYITKKKNYIVFDSIHQWLLNFRLYWLHAFLQAFLE